MLESSSPPGLIARAQAFTGVAVLVALLFSFPWLPISSPSSAQRSEAVLARLPSGPTTPSNPPGWHFTMHLVSTEEEARLLQSSFPDPESDIVLVVLPEDEVLFQRFRREVNDYRAGRQLPAVKIDDRRVKP